MQARNPWQPSPVVRAQPAAMAAGKNIGTVKNWNPQKGWGMIQSPAMQALYGKDIFFMRSGVAHGEIFAGAKVSFMVGQGAKGPQGEEVQVLGGSAMQHNATMNPMQFAFGFGPQGSKHVIGCIKHFNDEKGWGHIDCAEMRAIYGKDIIVLRSALNGQPCQAGDYVSFKVAQGQKGPEASDVVVLPKDSFGVNGEGGTMYVGTIKNFNAEKGYGFIACADTRALFQKDILVHKMTLGSLPTVGEEIHFAITMNDKGMPEATNVAMAVGYATALPGGKGPRAKPY